MRHLLSDEREILRRVKEVDTTFIFTDFDGTLTPIVGHPEQAYLPEGMRDLLLNLSRRKDIRVAIISGRSMADIQSRVGVEGVFYAGNHGLEIEGPGLKFIHPGINIEDMKRIMERLSLIVRGIPGVMVEDKELSLSLHFRQVKESDLPRLNRIFFNFITPLRKEERVNIGRGKKIYDVKPPLDWDKGKAVEFILERVGRKPCLPLYLGDDITDEDGFKAAQEKGGLGILVGNNALSSAEYYLNDVEEVETFLTNILVT